MTNQPDDYYGALIRERDAAEAAALLADECRKKDRLINLQRAALDVWKQAHPHEQSPGACARALAEKDAALAEARRGLVSSMSLKDGADVRYSVLLAWAREAREILDDSSLLATSEMDFRIRALLARAPEGVK